MRSDIVPDILHSVGFRGDLGPCRLPDSGVEGNGVDKLGGRNHRLSVVDSVRHISDRSNASRLIGSDVMLIVSHNDHIVAEDSLLPEVVETVVLVRRIVVDGKEQVVVPARDGQLPDKLDVSLAVVLRQLLKVNIDSVNPVGRCLADQLIDQVRSCREGIKKFSGIVAGELPEAVDQPERGR